MPYTADLSKLLAQDTFEAFQTVTKHLENSDIQYVYPYDLKLFIIQYAKAVAKHSNVFASIVL